MKSAYTVLLLLCISTRATAQSATDSTDIYFQHLDLNEVVVSSPAGQGNGIKALFFGRDKGRREKLLRLAGELDALGVGTEIHITKNRSTEKSGNEDLMKYGQVLAMTAQTDVLLDFSAAPGSGLSLRALEALYGGKKLITDNPEVLEYDFYSCGNVYVPGRESGDLKTFLQATPAQVPGRIKEYYLLSRWLKRFDE